MLRYPTNHLENFLNFPHNTKITFRIAFSTQPIHSIQ